MSIPAMRYTGDNTPRLAKDEVRSAEEVDHDATPLVKAVITDAMEHTPGPAPLTTPSDAILLSVDATVTLQMRYGSSTMSIPLLGKIWHPISASHITGVTAGTVFVGWQRKRKLDVHIWHPSVVEVGCIWAMSPHLLDHRV